MESARKLLKSLEELAAVDVEADISRLEIVAAGIESSIVEELVVLIESSRVDIDNFDSGGIDQ